MEGKRYKGNLIPSPAHRRKAFDGSFIVLHVRSDRLLGTRGCLWGKVAHGWVSSGFSGSQREQQAETGAGGSCVVELPCITASLTSKVLPFLSLPSLGYQPFFYTHNKFTC